MNTFDLDPKGYLPLIQPLLNCILVRLGVRGEEKARSNVACCA